MTPDTAQIVARRRRSGTPMATYLKERSVSGPNGCIVWLGAKSQKGHGRLRIDGRQMWAHRVAYEIVNGPIPEGLFACHRCDNPICINPEHIFLGTIAENNADMVRKGRQARGSGNGQSKLTEWRVMVVRKAVAQGMPIAAVARKLRMSAGTISCAVSGKTWGHVPQNLGTNNA